ncbi:PH and SEC7 domain-containing protein isoform X2 [Chironomus tepperi]|uniref:PH and SEC7 domain-containing protein isoform X2 n=1 Tax=Chironomus tepperi TaxID=113505 RepID=UPI00391F86B2
MDQKKLLIKLNKDEYGSFGFSLLGKFEGIPHVIYEVIEDSPAADEIEAGDVILKVNGTDVHRYSTKEVLKCLRLSEDPVTLELKRDPNIKDHVRKYLAATSAGQEIGNSSSIPSSPVNNSSKGHRISSSDSSASRKSRIPVNNVRISSISAPQSPQAIKPKYQSQIPTANGITQKKQTPRFEAYMMTGDLILNLSRTPQSSNLIPAQAKKSTMDSLRDSPVRSLKRKNGVAPKAIYDSSPSESSSASINELGSYETSENHIHQNSSSKDDNRKASKLSRFTASDSHTTNESLDEEEEQLIMENSNNPSPEIFGDERNNKKYNITNIGCANNTSSSSSSSPTNTNSSNSSTNNNYDGGGSKDHENDGDQEINIDRHSSSSHGHKNQKYKVLYNEENQQQQQQNNLDVRKELNVTPSLSMSSTTTTSSASTTINRSENLLTPTLDVNISHSVPTSPTSLSTPLLDAAKKRDLAVSSVPTSPECIQQEIVVRRNSSNIQNQQNGVQLRKCDVSGFRTSRSEDHLQHSQREGTLGNAIPIDIDEDINSSLNTLLDTRHDSEDSQNSNRDLRVVWTYNAPIAQNSTNIHGSNNTQGITSPTSHSSSISTSPQHTDSPASPTSVSSSVMSSSGSKGNGLGNLCGQNIMFLSGGDQSHSVSEAISNISSPDYQDEHDLLSTRDLSAAMAISDPSDSDSTLIVDQVRKEKEQRAVIQVMTNDGLKCNANDLIYTEDELATLTNEPIILSVSENQENRGSSPISDDGSDVDSLHSFHYSPKAVDIPSAVRLAKRLYTLDGFKKSDVSRHLSKNNEFSRVVADEYLKYFQFEKLTLDESLRQFLKQFALSGETQERERVLVHFSKRYLDCNPNTFNSQDAVHTLTCAIMLLNTDLHGQNIGRKMTCSEFIENLSELNDGDNFPKDVLKHLYQAIKSNPLEWALDDEPADINQKQNRHESSLQGPPVGANPFLDIPQNIPAVEYKKGYVMRKCCFDSNNKKTPFGKRSWKMFYCTLRDPLVMYLHKDERGFHKNQLSDNVHNAIRIHHSLATKATDYTKKQHVFRLQTSDQSEYLFQTSDSKELQSWIDTINFVCASFSAPPLEGGVGSQKRFQRPLLPCSQSKLLLRDQLASHEEQVTKLESEITEHKQGTVPTKGLALQNYREKEAYLQFELKRYKTYVYLLSSHLNSNPTDLINIIINSGENSTPTTPTTTTLGEEDELRALNQQQGTNRYSYRAAIYRSEQDIG